MPTNQKKLPCVLLLKVNDTIVQQNMQYLRGV